MKKIVLLLVFFSCVCFCSAQGSGVVSAAYYKAKYEAAQDSIRKLNERPIMTADQFVRLYKYDRVKRAYLICKRNPTQKKYLNGWLARIIEGK
jgi:hypothetical protein